MKKLLTAILSFVLCLISFGAVACDSNQVSELKEKQLINQEYVRWMGRTLYDDVDMGVHFYHAGSGFVVNFTGTKLTVSFDTTFSQDDNAQPRILVQVDKQSDAKGSIITLSEEDCTLDIAKDLEDGKHTVKVTKLSEATDADTAVYSLSTDGKFNTPPTAPSLKIQFIGGATTAGRGVLGGKDDVRTTQNSTITQSFAYFTAAQYGADAQYITANGAGIKWSDGSSNNLFSLIYPATGLDEKNELKGTWAHGKWTPEIIVVDSGSVDYRVGKIGSLSGTERDIAVEEYGEATRDFARILHSAHPQAKIIWLTDNSCKDMQTITQSVLSTLTYTDTYTYLLINEGTPLAAEGNAHATMQLANAYKLSGVLETLGYVKLT